MLDPVQKTAMTFASSELLAQWLELNHDRKSELWVKVFKVNSGLPSVTWNEIVIEALCWGWIDGIKKSIDGQTYLQRITPRKPLSSWSKRNRTHVERLISEGRMTEFGLAHVDAAKRDGRWQKAYAASEMQVPDDFINALKCKPAARAFYQSLTKSNRYVIAHGLISAKKSQTRLQRFEKFLAMLERAEKPK